MCAQCISTAAVTVAGATGLRAWLATRGWAWVTPRLMRWASAALLTVALVAAGALSGSGSGG
jgi:hypothetical protein